MSIQYFSGFFQNGLPVQMVEFLRGDLAERKSLVVVMGFGNWDYSQDPEIDLNFAKDNWFDPAGILFDEYHFIGANMPKERAHELLRDASMILLQGGYTTLQNDFLKEHELAKPIKESAASIIMGISGGAKNMGAKVSCRKSDEVLKKSSGIYDGLGFGNFYYEPYFSLENNEIINNELIPLSQSIDIYATCDKSFLRVEGGKVSAYGNVWRISNSELQKQK
ncbi:MAG: Type 1 glutamine amidotransferase-like domain-containing protein [Defluviitaleaceae bacterium]|nr:Type 1 glutamine amidotransferase-like domain-containing protein [Defluviitaleaceae bacterium]